MQVLLSISQMCITYEYTKATNVVLFTTFLYYGKYFLDNNSMTLKLDQCKDHMLDLYN